MQRLVVVAACCCAILAPTARAAFRSAGVVRKAEVSQSKGSPIAQIVGLLSELKTKVETDGKSEQEAYDKYACWCEETLATKAKDIVDGKTNIEALEKLRLKLKAELAAHSVDIAQLKKDVKANVASQKEATDVRTKEGTSYEEGKVESEQCVGALEAAIGVLSGAGNGKKGFLETLQQAQLLSAAASIRGILGRPTARRAASRAVSESDLSIVSRFVERPEDFVAAHAEGGFLSAAQIANNPFGDYAPQSGQVQGILKSMYSSFASDLERANAEEAVKVKSFEELMGTKKAELKTLQATLQSHTMSEAEKAKKVAESKTSLDDARSQLKNDEAFFARTKNGCKSKAGDWAQRTRLRTEELHSFAKAIEVLSSGEQTFVNATTTMFLQLAAHGHKTSRGVDVSKRAYEKISFLASRYGNLGLAKIAVLLKTGSGGHFDKVINSIDRMHEVLRAEEQEDIAHRDRCQGSVQKNTYKKEDLDYSIKKTEAEIKRMEDEETGLQDKMTALEGDINKTKTDKAELLDMRGKEQGDHLQAMRDDNDAVALLDQAITTLTEFYNKNGIPLSLRQKAEPEAAPEIFKSGSYGDKGAESGGIIAILSMIKEDLQMETQNGRRGDATAQSQYELDRKGIEDMLRSQKASRASLKTELAELQFAMVNSGEFKEQKDADMTAAKEKGEAIGRDCAWVDSHFDSRRKKRKDEMDGLLEAKNYLAGVESGDEI